MSNMTPILQKVFDDFVAAEQERDALKLENAVLKARVAELEAALLRARTLPEITPEILQALAEMDCWATGPAPQPDINLRLINRDYSYGPLGWTNSARAFVELLNEGRKV